MKIKLSTKIYGGPEVQITSTMQKHFQRSQQLKKEKQIFKKTALSFRKRNTIPKLKTKNHFKKQNKVLKNETH